MKEITCEKKGEFVEWYREFFKEDKELPCLRCSDDTIARCSTAISSNLGCTLFQQYVLNAHSEKSSKRGYEPDEN
jgi:hypothetical protein